MKPLLLALALIVAVPAVAKAMAELNAHQAYLDGELCGIAPGGITSLNIGQLASDRGNAAAWYCSCSIFPISTAKICASAR